jgi:choline dehydrogenase-like flavoprotein
MIRSPASRGDVKLASANPFDSPLIDPNYLGHQTDLAIITYAVKAMKKLLSADSFKDFIVKPWGDLANVNTDDEIATYARANAGSMWHACGTASMSPKVRDP